MDCFIKDGKTFITKSVCIVIDYAITINSIYDEVSTIKVVASGGADEKEGDFLIYGAFIGIIKEITRSELYVEIKCENIVKIFSREIIFIDNTQQVVETYLKNAINAYFTNASDIVYRLSFLNITSDTQTISPIRPDVENGIWNIKSFISKIRRVLNIIVTFTATRTQLQVHISAVPIAYKNMDLSNRQLRILEESYSNKRVGKITSRLTEKINDTEVITIKDWYLLENGTITNTYTANNRVFGDWIIIDVRDAASVKEDVINEFAKNTYSHKIKLAVETGLIRFNFYDHLKIVNRGRLFYSYISAVRISKTSLVTEYQCGELRTSMTDKIQEEL